MMHDSEIRTVAALESIAKSLVQIEEMMRSATRLESMVLRDAGNGQPIRDGMAARPESGNESGFVADALRSALLDGE